MDINYANSGPKHLSYAKKIAEMIADEAEQKNMAGWEQKDIEKMIKEGGSVLALYNNSVVGFLAIGSGKIISRCLL